MHRLMTGSRKIDDRESTKSKTPASVVEYKFAKIIWPAMGHLIAHSRQQRLIDASS
jgi:hypothetical protein